MPDTFQKVLKDLKANEDNLVAIRKRVEYKALVGTDTSNYMKRSTVSNTGVKPQPSNKPPKFDSTNPLASLP